jgi:hypothetical protein
MSQSDTQKSFQDGLNAVQELTIKSILANSQESRNRGNLYHTLTDYYKQAIRHAKNTCRDILRTVTIDSDIAILTLIYEANIGMLEDILEIPNFRQKSENLRLFYEFLERIKATEFRDWRDHMICQSIRPEPASSLWNEIRAEE